MLKKLRSNRDPGDTVFTELRREFKPQINYVAEGFKKKVDTYPRLVFWLMVINITLSAVLSFTVFRHPSDPPGKPVKITAPVSDGFGQIMQASQAISEMLRLKKAIDSLSAKKQLDRNDSLALENALDRFQQLNKQLNPKK